MAVPAMIRSREASLPIVLIIWLVPQLMSLALSAARVWISAHPPQPIESMTLTQLAVVQLITAALFAHLLFHSTAKTIAVALVAAPPLQLGGFLASATMTNVVAAWLLTCAVVIVIAAISIAVTREQRRVVTALSSTWILGGILLAYLHAEFAPSCSAPPLLFGPAYGVIDITQSPIRFSGWWCLVAIVPLSAVIASYFVQKVRRSNPRENAQVEESGNPPTPAQ